MLLTCRILSTDTSDVNPWNPDLGHNFLALQQKNLPLIWPLCWQNSSKQSILQMSSYGIYKPTAMFARSKLACTKQWNVDILNWLWGEWANCMFRHIRFTTTNLLGTNMSLESSFPLEIKSTKVFYDFTELMHVLTKEEVGKLFQIIQVKRWKKYLPSKGLWKGDYFNNYKKLQECTIVISNHIKG